MLKMPARCPLVSDAIGGIGRKEKRKEAAASLGKKKAPAALRAGGAAQLEPRSTPAPPNQGQGASARADWADWPRSGRGNEGQAERLAREFRALRRRVFG